MLTIQAVPAFEDNYIWVIRAPGERHVAVVDPGDAEPVLALLRRESLELAAVLVTHHHGDHVGGIRTLVSHHPAPVYGPAGERIATVSHRVGEGERISLAALGAEFTVIDVPGHTAGHISFFGHGALFCGDTLFTGGCGRLFEGTPEQMHASLSKLASLPPQTAVYCAHEYTLANLKFAQVVEPDNPALLARKADAESQRAKGQPTVPSTLELERATNPFLRCGEATVVAAAESFAGRTLAPGAEVFAIVRHWKDTLD